MNTDLLNASGARAGEANDSGAHRKPPNFSTLFSSRILLAFAGVLAFLTAPAVESQVSLQDTQPPTVAITSPAPGSTLKGTVTVGVSVSDTVGVARVVCLGFDDGA